MEHFKIGPEVFFLSFFPYQILLYGYLFKIYAAILPVLEFVVH